MQRKNKLLKYICQVQNKKTTTSNTYDMVHNPIIFMMIALKLDDYFH